MKHTLVFASLLAGTTGLGLAASSAISGTGWNEDLVVENTTAFDWNAVPGATTSTVVGWVFYETGWGSASQGINNSGAYTGASGASYQMQPYSNANNAILLDTNATSSATFTLDTAAQFSELAFLVTTQAGGGSIFWSATVNFSDASSTVLNGEGLDWINTNSTGVVVQNHGLGNPGAQQFYDGNLYMVERTFALSAGDQAKTVTSIGLAGLTPDTRVVFHAISGEVVPEPATAALLSLGVLGLLRRRRK